MEGLDHGLELVDLLSLRAARGVGGMRGEVADRVVAPVIAEAAFKEEAVVEGLVGGQQLDRRDAQVQEVLDGCRMRQAGEGAADRLGHARVTPREALEVSLIDDRLVVGHPRACLVAPVELVTHDDRARHRCRAVEVVPLARRGGHVPEDGVTPIERAVDGARIGVDEQLVGVAAPTAMRFPGSVHAVAVPLARADARQVAMPGVAGHLGQLDACLAADVVEEAELDALGNPREDAEVGAQAVERGAQRIGLPCPGGWRVVTIRGDAWLLRHIGRRDRRVPAGRRGDRTSARESRTLATCPCLGVDRRRCGLRDVQAAREGLREMERPSLSSVRCPRARSLRVP